VFPPVHYYMGLAQEGLGSSAAPDSFRAYLDIRGSSSKDDLASDARHRIRADQS